MQDRLVDLHLYPVADLCGLGVESVSFVKTQVSVNVEIRTGSFVIEIMNLECSGCCDSCSERYGREYIGTHRLPMFN